jgi:hypothetical protein
MLPQYKLVAGGNNLALPFTIANIITILICATIGYLLLFKTELVIRLFKIEEENVNIDEKNILSIGCKLIGIYIFVSEIGSFFKTIIMFLGTLQNKLKSGSVK